MSKLIEAKLEVFFTGYHARIFVEAGAKRGTMIIRENRRETIKSNSWKLSLHVRPTFSSLLYIHIGFVQFFALNKREKFVPRANVHPVEMEVFSKKRKTNMFRMQHPATVYIFPLLALFRRYSIRPADQPV